VRGKSFGYVLTPQIITSAGENMLSAEESAEIIKKIMGERIMNEVTVQYPLTEQAMNEQVFVRGENEKYMFSALFNLVPTGRESVIRECKGNLEDVEIFDKENGIKLVLPSLDYFKFRDAMHGIMTNERTQARYKAWEDAIRIEDNERSLFKQYINGLNEALGETK
jgi:hypothetical protein